MSDMCGMTESTRLLDQSLARPHIAGVPTLAPPRPPTSIAGDHPDSDEYQRAMADQGKSLIRITPTSWGPVASGGFPPEVARRMG